ncbi:unnamed protein product [Mytilus edulis]|uniref:Uncharacterized protein n=1 Tax=Mytilus edulis TaxID=6550 RepID=A0A8S3TJ87_MYTED|nr:unnamed protein product [Mytilus edulis]
MYSSGKENYDRLLSVFHTGTDVKRSLLEQYLREKHLNLLDWLTDLNQTFLKFDDVKRAIKRSSTIDFKDLELSTIDIFLKFNCFDLFWDVCLLNTRLEEILNDHKDELLGIYQTSMTQYDIPSSSTKQYTPSLTKTQWEILFKSGKCSGIRKGGNVADISATKDITLSSLDETLNVLLLHTVCPLYKSVNIVSECQIQILKMAVINSECERFTFENLWNRIESHIISIASHCKEIPILLVDGKYTNGTYSLSVVESADKDLQVVKSVCSNQVRQYKQLAIFDFKHIVQVMKADQNETEDDIQTDGIFKK